MKIVIAGDVLPQNCNEALFEQGNITALLDSELVNRFKIADLRICNLEGPLTDIAKGIDKSGPCIKANTATVNGLKSIGFDCVSIANNHIMDFGNEGYESTIEALDRNAIMHVGADKDCFLAKKPLIIDIDNVKIGIYSCAEYEFTIATDSAPGANAFDALYTLDDIFELKKEVDYLIVLYHGAKEYYRYPVPYVQKRCRRMVEKGANLVLCQHSHCVGCFEKWGEGQILYGQGNFLFHRSNNEYTNTGLLVEVEYDTENWNVKYIPVIRTVTGVKLAGGDIGKEILSNFERRSEKIKEKGFIETEYRQFADYYVNRYYDQFVGRLSIFFRILRKMRLRNVYNILIRKTDKLNMLNNLRCEAHRDLFIHGLLDDLSK